MAGGDAPALAPLPAMACAIDNVASVYANGARATLTTTGTSPGALWATFPFGQAIAAAAPVKLDESRADLLRSLDSATVAAPYRWTFGDGTGAALGHVVTHRYARPGLYLIGVEGFDGQTRRWFPFERRCYASSPWAGWSSPTWATMGCARSTSSCPAWDGWSTRRSSCLLAPRFWSGVAMPIASSSRHRPADRDG